MARVGGLKSLLEADRRRQYDIEKFSLFLYLI
jgi:hypothetical protein